MNKHEQMQNREVELIRGQRVLLAAKRVDWVQDRLDVFDDHYCTEVDFYTDEITVRVVDLGNKPMTEKQLKNLAAACELEWGAAVDIAYYRNPEYFGGPLMDELNKQEIKIE